MLNNMIFIACRAARFYIRYIPIYFGKEYMWYNICQKYINWRGIEIKCITKDGIHFRCSTDDMIQSYIYYFGCWEPNLTKYIKLVLKEGDTFVDIGANIGYFSLLASRLVGRKGTVVSIEASPFIFGTFEDMIALNGATNIRAVNVAVSDREGTLPIYLADKSNIGATTTTPHRVDGGTPKTFECEVSAKPIDRILTSDEIASARLVKIDVEGAEVEVLKTILARIDRFSRDVEFVVEISAATDPCKKQTVEDLFKLFDEAGFKAFELENDYSANGYLTRMKPVAPRVLPGLPVEQTDIIFSRRASLAF